MNMKPKERERQSGNARETNRAAKESERMRSGSLETLALGSRRNGICTHVSEHVVHIR